MVVPYIARTDDAHRFRVMHGQTHIFKLTIGGDYTVDAQRVATDVVETEGFGDAGVKERASLAPIPETMAEDLWLEFGAMRGRQDSA